MVPYLIIAAVALQRLIEVGYARRNTRALLMRGGIEVGRRHYPLFVLLHAAWLLTILVALPEPTVIHAVPLVIFLLLQAARLWVIASLGPYWTTRIITLPGAALIRRGPYRYLRHPNYLIVAGEIMALPLVFGEVWVALIFSVLNAMLLAWRIHVEEGVLRERMVPQTYPPSIPSAHLPPQGREAEERNGG
jgi:methyltransferase